MMENPVFETAFVEASIALPRYPIFTVPNTYTRNVSIAAIGEDNDVESVSETANIIAA